jgi:hypothetical protein
MTMKDNNDVVIVNLDRQRELRFGHKALKKLAAVSGKGVEQLGDDDLDSSQLEEIYFYGLQRDARLNGETLTMEQMEDILDEAPSMEYLISKVTEAMEKSMGSLSGNGQAAGKPGNLPSPSRGTGRNR